MGYYVGNPSNLLTPDEALFSGWYAVNTVINNTSGQYQYTANGQQIQPEAMVPVAEYIPVLKGQTYTFGVTRVSGTGTLNVALRGHYLDDGSSWSTINVNNTVAGRATLTFSAPNNDRPKAVNILLTLTTGYAAGTPLVVKGATLVYGATDLGELPPSFFGVTQAGQFDMRIVLYNANAEKYKVLIGADKIEASSVLNDISSLKFQLNPSQPEWSTLRNTHVEAAVEVTTNGVNWVEPDNMRFYRMNNSDDKASVATNGEFGFVSWAWMLNRMGMNYSPALNADFVRPFNAATPGTILKTLIDEAKAAGVMTAMAYDFSTTTDSAGTAWPVNITTTYEPGVKIMDVLRSLTDQGLVDWCTRGRVLRVFVANTSRNRDLSASVIYRVGQEITQAPDKTSNENFASRVTGYGDDNVKVTLTNAGAVTPYGHMESSVSYSGVKDTGTITVLQNTALSAGSAILEQKTRSLNLVNILKFPFFHYLPGDRIATLDTENQTTPDVDRVQQITVTYNREAGVAANVVLNTRMEEWQIKLAKRTNALTSGKQLGGPTPPKPNYPGQDSRTPKAPIGLVGSTDVYQDINGTWLAAITLDWQDVTQATDNTAMDITSYEVHYRFKNNITPQEWRFITAVMNPGTVTNSYVTMSAFELGRTYEFRVRAIANTSKTPGLWSATFEITSAVDTTPPPVPMPVTLTTRGGAVSITWNGRGVGNVPMPLDFNYAQLEVADDSLFTVNLRVIDQFYGSGTTAIADLPYNVTKFFRLKAVDRSRNESAYSATSSITTAALVNADLIGRVVDNANMVLGSVNAAILADDAVTTPKIKAGSIVANKLAVGGTNRNIDPHFANTALNAIRIATSGSPAFCTAVPPSSTEVDGYMQIAPTTATATEVSLTDPTLGYPIDVVPGEKYLVSFKFTRVSGTASGGIVVQCILNNGTTNAVTTPAFDGTTANGVLSAVWTAPAGAIAVRLKLNVGAAISSQRFSNVIFTLQAGATLIEDGAITTNKIVANAVTSAQIAALSITANELAANAVTTDKINAAAIQTIHLKANAIDGMRIVGAEFRTTYAVTGTRMVMYDQGLIARNAANAITLNFDAATGDTMINGVIRTNAQGTYPWIELNNALWPSNYLGLRFYVVSAHAVQPEVSGYRTATDGWIAGSIVMRSGAQVASGSDVVTAGRAEVILQPGGRWLIGQRLGTAYGRNYITNTGPPGQGGSDETWVGGFGGVLLRSAGAVKVYLDNTAGTSQTLMTQWGAGSIQLIHSTMIELNDGSGAAMRTGGGVVEFFRWIRYGSPPGGTSGSNVIMVGNLIGIATSLNRDKLNQEAIPLDYRILDLAPKTWRDRYQVVEKPNTTIRVAGFVAEEVRALSASYGGIFDPLLTFNTTGSLQGLQYDRVIAYMLPVVKDLHQRLTSVEQEKTELENRIAQLEAAVQSLLPPSQEGTPA